MKKRLYRSHKRVLAGVLGGLAEYFNWRANYVRITFLVICGLFSLLPLGILIPIGVYGLLAWLLPLNPEQTDLSWLDIIQSFSQLRQEKQTSVKKTASERTIITDAREKDL